jgi:signal transduction histidine kinase/DNA-binding response OmpR family regulator
MLPKKTVNSESNAIGVYLDALALETDIQSFDALFNTAIGVFDGSPYALKLLYEKATNFYSKTKEYQKLESCCKQLVDYYAEEKSHENLGLIYLKLGIIKRNFAEYEAAHEYYKKAYASFKKANSTIGIVKTYNNIGNIHKDKGELTLSLENYLKAKELSESSKNKTLIDQINQNLAQIYFQLNYDKKAKELFLQDLKDFIKEKNHIRTATSITGIAEIQLKQNKPYKAQKSIKKAIHFWEKTGDRKGLGEAYLVYGKILDILEDKANAILKYKKSYENYEAVKHAQGTIKVLSLLGRAYLAQDDTKTAKRHLKEARLKAEKIVASYELLELYDLLHQVYQREEKYKDAYEALLQYNKVKEKVYSLSSQVKINEIQTKYELDKMELSHQKERELHDYKSNLFSNLTHEFRTPLTLMKAPLELIKEEENVLVIKDRVQYLQNNTDHLLKLVNQLLDINKIEAGKMPVNYKIGSIMPIVGHVVHMFTEDANQKNISFTYNIPSSELLGSFDEDKLEKILYNLLSNALKFTPSGGKIHLHVQAHNEQIVIKVLDNGPGISEENKDLIFEKYYRINQSGKISGSGIGLSFVKELVDLLQGSIEVLSKENKGSVFQVRLPYLGTEKGKNVFQVEQEFSAAKILPLNGDALRKAAEIKKKATLLIVEDNYEIKKLIAEIFSKEYKIIHAENGKEGLLKAKENLPDLIISDIMMPIKDGNEMCEELKQHELTNHIPIVMLTAKEGLKNKLIGLQKGADSYLSKPFSVEELKTTVTSLISQRHKLREHYSKNPLFSASQESMVSADEVFIKINTENVVKNLSNEKFSVEDLAELAMMSRFTLIRKFKSVLNTTPNEFIQRIRLETAKNMLINRVASISEIAYRVGFASVTYFSSSFKKHYGVSPRDFVEK